MRFDFELDLLEGRLAVADLPEAWRERFAADFGVVPETDSDGVLQDVHWYGGFIGGAFQGYTLGNVMSAQFFRAAVEAHPEIPAEIATGEFATLRGWLSDRLYRQDRKLTPSEVVLLATGAPLRIEPYIVTSKPSTATSIVYADFLARRPLLQRLISPSTLGLRREARR